jgi:pilus assembly protein Flp/PilA
MVNSIVQFMREEEGVTALEYGLLAALIAAAIMGAVTVIGTTVSNTLQSIANSMQAFGS